MTDEAPAFVVTAELPQKDHLLYNEQYSFRQ